MATRKEREKKRAYRVRHAEREKKELHDREVLHDNEDTEELGFVRDSDTPEEVTEKDYDSPAVAMYEEMPHPTSWEESDALREAQEKAAKVSDMSWTAGDLVRNIVRSDMQPDDKGKAIAEVGNGFARRVKDVAGEKKTVKKEYDLELLEIKALIASDKRRMPFYEHIGDFLAKATLTDDKLTDDDFAIVTEKERLYPIHDKAHVRAALARAAHVIENDRDNIADVRAALPKIRAAAKKVGIGVIEKSQSAVVVEKDLNGNYRAVMWPTNNFKDLDGEIISEKAHEEYTAWVNNNMNLAPVFTTWHMPELVRKAQVDFAAYESGYLIMSAPLTEQEAAGLFQAQAICDLGMSHGSVVMERDPHDRRVITKYRMVEVSDLPLENAANPFTDFSVISKEADMDKQKYLASLLGEERAKEFLEKTGLKQAELREQQVEEKAKSPDPAPAPAEPKAEAQPDMEAIFKAVAERFDIPGLNEFVTKATEAIEKVGVLESLVKELSADTDEKLAEKIAPPVTQKMSWTKRPSQSEDNKVNEADEKDKTLVKSGPTHWLSEVSGTEPVTA